nr:MAG TPA: Head Tail Connector Protein [Caudoviricetes sp.]
MQYVDFLYYKEVFKGTVIPSETVFNGLEIKAQAYVDKITFGRITDEIAGTEAVKNAICAACETQFQYSGHEGVASESNDGYSVSYSGDEKAAERAMYSAAKLFLPSELLYQGVDM